MQLTQKVNHRVFQKVNFYLKMESKNEMFNFAADCKTLWAIWAFIMFINWIISSMSGVFFSSFSSTFFGGAENFSPRLSHSSQNFFFCALQERKLSCQ